MKSKQIYFLLVVLVLCVGVGIGRCFWMPFFPAHPSTFKRQTEYAENLENKLVHLLEPATGVGNVRASVVAEMIHQNTNQTKFDFKNATRTTYQDKGLVLRHQSVSVLINATDKSKQTSYQNLIKGAIGFTPSRGDSLSIEFLPFVKVPVWTFGLSPLCLMRMGGLLGLLLLVGLFWLVKEWHHAEKKGPSSYCPDPVLWHKAKKCPAYQWVLFLKTKRPEISALLLYHLDREKAAEIIDLLPENYVKQVILHLNHIEKLSPGERQVLFKEAEDQLRPLAKAASLQPESAFDDPETWRNADIAKLLHYVSKKDLIMAIQTTPEIIQQLFKSHMPPALWQELMQRAQQSPCSVASSQQAKEKIIRIAHLLREK